MAQGRLVKGLGRHPTVLYLIFAILVLLRLISLSCQAVADLKSESKLNNAVRNTTTPTTNVETSAVINAALQNVQDLQPLPLDGEDLEADDDSAYGSSVCSWNLTQIEHCQGYCGKWSALSDFPEDWHEHAEDEKQFESMETWDHKFDLVHIRNMNGTLPAAEWENLYRRACHNLAPGGWIEHFEAHSSIRCDDGTMPKDSLSAKFASDLEYIAAQTGNDMYVTELMRSGIEAAGFTKVCERDFEFPRGDWPKHPAYKEAGALYRNVYRDGLEGWLMYALTRFEKPKPWFPEEVAIYVAKLRKELNQNWHIYQSCKRVSAQYPYETKDVQEPTAHNLASETPSPTQPVKKRQRTEGEDAAAQV